MTALAPPPLLDVSGFDCTPELSSDERAALRSLGWDLRRHYRSNFAHPAWPLVHRLLLPLDAARALLRDVPDTAHSRRCQRDAASLILHRSADLGTSFWGWSELQWRDLIGSDEHAFVRPWPKWVRRAVRPYVLTYAYLLGGFSAFQFVGLVSRIDLARRVFGHAPVDAAVGQVVSVLRGWGYQQGRDRPRLRSEVCQLLLANRSPYLEDLSDGVLLRLRRSAEAERSRPWALHGIHRALAALGYATPPVSPPPERAYGAEPAISEWMLWIDRWHDTSTLSRKTRQIHRSLLTQVGRWMAAENIATGSPELWTREICAAWVARVDRLRVGDYAQACAHVEARAGQPLLPASKAMYLCVTRTFFHDCQEWGWIKRHFDPRTALATPRSVKNLIGPNPRVIADDIWAKLLWAGVNLTPADLVDRVGRDYPFELLRAVTMVWLFGGLRSDELVRLRLGCIRWMEEGQDGSGGSCLLDVPVHKTGTAFTKPVDALVGRAIAQWEAVRPVQPRLPDRKTGERVDLLFAYRFRRIAPNLINRTVIPILCRKAGVPREDVRGRITSHRARSTIATQLYNAKEPMTLFELQAWLGHRSPETTQRYARITPNTLTKAYTDAGYFARNVRTIEVLIDRGAVLDGTAAAGVPWQHYDLGHGYCSYTFFEQCPHRMACARCDFYIPKPSARAQLLEAKSDVDRRLALIPLTDGERAAVEQDQQALNKLLDGLADTPTPAGPTPREIVQQQESTPS